MSLSINSKGSDTQPGLVNYYQQQNTSSKFLRQIKQSASSQEIPCFAKQIALFNHRLICTGLCLCLCACSVFKPSFKDKPGTPDPGTPEVRAAVLKPVTSEKADLKDPLSVELAQAFYVGSRLQVKVRVKFKETLPANSVVLSLLTLAEGKIVERQTQLLGEVAEQASISGSKLEAGRSLLVNFEFESKGVSEYQIQCRWGDDASSYLASIKAAPSKLTVNTEEPAVAEPLKQELSPDSLRLLEVELLDSPDSCQGKCQSGFYLKTKLQNASTATLSEIKLAVGILKAAASEELPKPPPDYQELRKEEELIDLAQLILLPGKEKRLKVNINQPFPADFIDKMDYIPYIRIVSVRKF